MSVTPGVLALRRSCAVVLAGMLLLTLPPSLSGQGRTRRGSGLPENLPYDGRFVFTRIRYGTSLEGWGFRWGGSRWSHDYPRADRHLPRILSEVTAIRANVDGSNVYDLDSPEIFQFPVIYLSEPGFWSTSDAEVLSLRRYLLKGGFIIFDDFELDQWHNFAAQMARVLPEWHPIQIEVDHPIFHAFFDLETIYFPHPLVNVTPSYFAIFRDNDPAGEMLAIVNYDNDVAEYWEWSDTGFLPIDITNEAYKLGINYIIYAMTH